MTGAIPLSRARVATRLRAFSTEARAESLPLIAALLVTAVLFQVRTGLFLDARNITNLLTEIAPLVLIAVASTLMIIQGEIDLSVGSIAGFTGALLAWLLAHEQLPWIAAVLLTFLAGTLATQLQGLIVVFGRVRSFAVTLAGYFIWYGVQLWILGPRGYETVRRQPIATLASERLSRTSSTALVLGLAVVCCVVVLAGSATGRTRRLAVLAVATAAAIALVTYLDDGGGVPLVFVLVLAITTVVWVILTRTRLGRHMYAVGGDLEAARRNGIAVARVKWAGFAAGGLLATGAGLSLVSYTGGSNTSIGTGPLLLAGIGASVVGGVSLLGGRGSVWGAVGGALLLQSVDNGLNLLKLQNYAVYIVEGLVVLLALLADAGIRRRLLR